MILAAACLVNVLCEWHTSLVWETNQEEVISLRMQKFGKVYATLEEEVTVCIKQQQQHLPSLFNSHKITCNK